MKTGAIIRSAKYKVPLKKYSNLFQTLIDSTDVLQRFLDCFLGISLCTWGIFQRFVNFSSIQQNFCGIGPKSIISLKIKKNTIKTPLLCIFSVFLELIHPTQIILGFFNYGINIGQMVDCFFDFVG